MNTKRVMIKISLALGIMLSTSVLFAQPTGGGGGMSGGGNPPSGQGGPIDNGAIMLVVGIAGYTYRKLKSENAVKL